VAAIHGSCMGGGTELALACHYRVLSSDRATRIALPEVNLGILPGMGGTQRLPRTIGIENALNHMLTGSSFYSRQAKRYGFADTVVYRHHLIDAARELILAHHPSKPKAEASRGLKSRLLEGNKLGRKLLFSQARKRALAKTRGNYPAPEAILECVERGIEEGMDRGLELEAIRFGQLGTTQVSRNLLGLFFATQQAKKQPSDEGARDVRHVGVLGAGLMGSGITQVSVDAGYDVWLKDQNVEAAARGRKSASRDWKTKASKHILTASEVDQNVSSIHASDGWDGFDHVDLVIEAVFEDREVKQNLYRELEPIISDRTVIASNTSSIPITELAGALKHPERMVGMHYFSPVPKMPLLEVIRAEKSSDEAVATAVRAGRAQGKTVIVVNDGPGFYTTRVVSSYMNEAMLLLEEGADARETDQIMKDAGFPVGPLTLLDEVGIDVGAHVASVLQPLFDERGGVTSTLSSKLKDRKELGRKSGKGIYLYKDGKRDGLNPTLNELLGEPDREPPGEDEIRDRLLLSMVNEAAWCLQDGILLTPQDGDLGAILGLGFPPFLGGPFRYLNQEGISTVLQRLDALQSSSGDRFSAPDQLRTMARNGERFYD
ncbi:MAG: 3-hydroxyacyl-CoA dehydrogenase NAD-binding domain-containing protein, partial [Balneolaceae bacterium]